MKHPEHTVVTKPLITWSLEGGIGLQLGLVSASLLLAVIRLLPLEFQRLIVNHAIRDENLSRLYLYCGGFLLSVLAGLGLKYGILYMQGLLGEKILSKMRKAFFTHALTLPWTFFLQHRPGSISTPLISYLGPVGDYLGRAWAVPLSNFLTLIFVGGYLVWINPFLALVSLGVYPLALVLLPRIQRLANRANQRRLVLVQELSGKIAESFSGIGDIQAHAGYTLENNIFSDLTNRLRRARIHWRLSKLGNKAVINFFTNFSPFFIFLAGGAYAIKGSLDMGELVAFLSAQTLLFSPWTELMTHVQEQQDAKVQYKKVQRFFDVPPAQAGGDRRTGNSRIRGDFKIRGLSLDVRDGSRILDNISFEIKAGELVALVGRSGSGKSILLNCLAGKIRDYQGQILSGETELKRLSNADLAPFVGTVSQTPYLFDGTLKENLLYPVKALGPDQLPGQDDMILAIQKAGLFPDLLLFGLNRIPEQGFQDKFEDAVCRMRTVIQKDLPEALKKQIRFFDPQEAPRRQTLLEKILGGRPLAKDTGAVMAWLPRIIPLLMSHDLLETVANAGLDHKIGTGGERLSGGQRQRLALAAVLLKHPGVLLLDEVGSGLDHTSRIRLSALLDELKGACTILAVEHNMAHVHTYDRICVMHESRMVETGTVDELMARKGFFFKMMSQSPSSPKNGGPRAAKK